MSQFSIIFARRGKKTWCSCLIFNHADVIQQEKRAQTPFSLFCLWKKRILIIGNRAERLAANSLEASHSWIFQIFHFLSILSNFSHGQGWAQINKIQFHQEHNSCVFPSWGMAPNDDIYEPINSALQVTLTRPALRKTCITIHPPSFKNGFFWVSFLWASLL